jgi:hypothetical protein
MLASTTFRRQLARRLLQIAALAGAAQVQGCLFPRCSGGPMGDPEEVCVQAPKAGGLCPVGDDAEMAIPHVPSLGPFYVVAGPFQDQEQCCYIIQQYQDCTGRPFLVEGRAVAAPSCAGAPGWREEGAPQPRVDDLSAADRTALAEAWTRDGLFEHASIASFGRFALELLAAGAPADLVEDAHLAALDEARHAKLCLGLASAYAGAPVGPGAFPFGGGVEVTADLASIAARVAREGCVGETVAAVQAAEQLARATDPAVRAALAIIAEDEARHAELAWRAVVWAISAGGDRVRDAVARVLAEVGVATHGSVGGGAPHEDLASPGAGPLDRHGRLDPEEQRRLAARTVAEVVEPAARALLAGAASRVPAAIEARAALPL